MNNLVQLKLKNEKKEIKFTDLEVGSTFEWYDEINGEGTKYVGMKVVLSNSYSYGILDLSDDVGTVFSYIPEYKILRVLDGIIIEEVVEKYLDDLQKIKENKYGI